MHARTTNVNIHNSTTYVFARFGLRGDGDIAVKVVDVIYVQMKYIQKICVMGDNKILFQDTHFLGQSFLGWGFKRSTYP